MKNKLIDLYNITYRPSIDNIAKYVDLFENTDDNSEMLHPLLVACDMRMKVGHGYISKKVYHGSYEKTSEFTNKYYDRIYENIDILSKEEIFLLLKFPYLKESKMNEDEVNTILELLKQIGYTIGKQDTSDVSNIKDYYSMDWRSTFD